MPQRGRIHAFDEKESEPMRRNDYHKRNKRKESVITRFIY